MRLKRSFVGSLLFLMLFFTGYAFANNWQYQQQMQRQQQMQQEQMRQQQARQQQEQMRRQQEEMRRQQEQMRRQQELIRQQQQAARQQQIQRQQEAQRQMQQRQQQALERKRLEQQKRNTNPGAAQNTQAIKQQASQQHILQQQKKIKDRQDRLNKIQKNSVLKQRSDKRKADERVNLTMAALLANSHAKYLPSTSPVKIANPPKTLSAHQKNRIEQRKKAQFTKKMAEQRKATQAKLKKMQADQKRFIQKKKAHEKLIAQEKAAKTGENASNFGVCDLTGQCTCSFHGDTQVLTRDGFEPIKSLIAGKDFVWARNEYSGEMDWKPVTAHYSNVYDETVAVTILNSRSGEFQTIRSNRIHPFYVSNQNTIAESSQSGTNDTGQWIEAQYLQSGNLLFSSSQEGLHVSKVEITGEPLNAYNLTVEDYHTYFIRGDISGGSQQAIWVHNDCRRIAIANARKLGKAGEDAVRAVHTIGDKLKITVNGRTRFPDGINPVTKTLSEVKNVASQGWTKQLKDYAAHAKTEGLKFDLYVKPTTTISPQLSNQIAMGVVNLKYIP